VREKRGDMKIRMGKGKSFGNAAVIFRLAILRGGRRNAKRMQLGGMQVIVLLARGRLKPLWRYRK
jgi:hypothetical protein